MQEDDRLESLSYIAMNKVELIANDYTALRTRWIGTPGGTGWKAGQDDRLESLSHRLKAGPTKERKILVIWCIIDIEWEYDGWYNDVLALWNALL